MAPISDNSVLAPAETLDGYGLLDRIPADRRFGTLEEALAAFHADRTAPPPATPSSARPTENA